LPTQPGRDAELADKLQDPFLRRSVKSALHLRRYMPFYVFGLIWVITLAAFPSIRDNGGGDTVSATSTEFTDDTTAVGTSESPTESAVDATVEGTVEPGASASTGGATPIAGSRAPGGSTTKDAVPGAVTAPGAAQSVTAEQARGAIQRNTGTTRLGQECKEGILQVPGSLYAPPCQNLYDGPNGGATFRGVTDKEIIIVRRKFPESANSRAVEEVNKNAGFASADVVEATRATFVKYLSSTYELYGRQVKYVLYESKNGNSTDEAQGKGKEGACQDADEIVKEIKAFAVLSSSAPFAECAAERQLMVFNGAPYYPESFYRKYNPYIFGLTMECERISFQLAEYISSRLIDKPAKFAGDPVIQAKKRLFGTYVPDNDGYQRCTNITEKTIDAKHGPQKRSRYNYQLDISRFPDQAAAAAIQFAADGVTSVVLACDYISATVLTEAAENQGFRPEWMTIGTGATDVDNSARLYNQKQVVGHLFGPSQLGATEKLIGPKSEPGRVYKQGTGKEIPEGTTGDYFNVSLAFNLLQSAGPALTPQNVAAGAKTLPPSGAPDFSFGYWSFSDNPDGTPGFDHTAVDDSREVFWVAAADPPAAAGRPAADKYFNGADGKNGTYKETYNGKRFRNGEWPMEEPPIYPPR